MPCRAAPCLWYAFLMQVFCTQSNSSSPLLVSLFRVLLPLLFLTGGGTFAFRSQFPCWASLVRCLPAVSHHSLLLELNGAERLSVALVLSSFKTQEYYRPAFLLSLSLTVLVALTYGARAVHCRCDAGSFACWLGLLGIAGSSVLVQWCIFVAALLVIHTDDKERQARAKKAHAAHAAHAQHAAAAGVGAGAGVGANGAPLPSAPSKNKCAAVALAALSSPYFRSGRGWASSAWAPVWAPA